MQIIKRPAASVRPNGAPEDWRWDDGVGFLAFRPDRNIEYGKAYFDNYVRRGSTAQGSLITGGRLEMVQRWVDASFTILDVGIGCGQFLDGLRRKRYKAFGTDVNPAGINWLQEHKCLANPTQKFQVLTFWDVLEHIPEPGEMFRFHQAEWILVSMPIYRDEAHVFRSKHYKPGEHCWYFTEHGLRKFMSAYGYDMVELNAFEIVHGKREDVWAFAFKRRSDEQ